MRIDSLFSLFWAYTLSVHGAMPKTRVHDSFLLRCRPNNTPSHLTGKALLTVEAAIPPGRISPKERFFFFFFLFFFFLVVHSLNTFKACVCLCVCVCVCVCMSVPVGPPGGCGWV